MNLASGGWNGQALALRVLLNDLGTELTPARQLGHLLTEGCDGLPLPGSGSTLQRWQALATVAAHDLSLAKLYEGHTDALAILGELQAPEEVVDSIPLAFGRELTADGAAARGRPVWGVWAAEAPGCRVTIQADPAQPTGSVRLQGRKAWCSGALTGSHGLLTAWWPGEQSGPQLVAVSLAQREVEVSDGGWQAVGMRGSASVHVSFDGALARCVGEVGSYLSRPGFWQGGAGIAACWYGGAMGLAGALHLALAEADPARRDPYRLAAAGRVDVTLRTTGALLRETARWIDQNPRADARAVALRARQAAVACAERVLHEVGETLGATPLCRNRQFAQAAADLPVFIRQSHGQSDYAALGAAAVQEIMDAEQGIPWAL
jgi:hypothetical protein